ncbi:MAG TPA: hypothetical protein VMU01_05610 [Rhizomicrobium sp.]|nr:hypothetical protein [Rhizomicrobium sp.]
MKSWLVLACAASFCGAAGADDLILSMDGMGRVEIGSSRDSIERVLHRRYELDKPCEVVNSSETAQLGVSYMIEANRLVRIDVDYYANSPEPLTIHTPEGIGLGSPEADVIKAYGNRVRVEPNPGDPTWHYLYVDTPDHSRGFAFDTDGKKVKSMHAGEYPALGYKDGCP